MLLSADCSVAWAFEKPLEPLCFLIGTLVCTRGRKLKIHTAWLLLKILLTTAVPKALTVIVLFSSLMVARSSRSIDHERTTTVLRGLRAHS